MDKELLHEAARVWESVQDEDGFVLFGGYESSFAKEFLPAALNHIEAQDELIQELTNKVIYLKELSAENRNIAIAAIRAIEKQEVDHGRYGEKLRHTLIEAGYLDAEERE